MALAEALLFQNSSSLTNLKCATSSSDLGLPRCIKNPVNFFLCFVAVRVNLVPRVLSTSRKDPGHDLFQFLSYSWFYVTGECANEHKHKHKHNISISIRKTNMFCFSYAYAYAQVRTA